jgi:hypothetical protein
MASPALPAGRERTPPAVMRRPPYGGRFGICGVDNDAVPPTKLCAVERGVHRHQKAPRLLRRLAPPGDADAGREEQRHALDPWGVGEQRVRSRSAAGRAVSTLATGEILESRKAA